MVGKTIRHVVDGIDGMTLLFTDGSSAVFSGEDYFRHELRSAAETRRAAAVEQGKRELARLGRLRRLGWLSVSCEERVRRRELEDARYRKWMETASPTARLMVEMRRDLSENLVRQSYSLLMAYADGRPRKAPCSACREESCPNAAWIRR